MTGFGSKGLTAAGGVVWRMQDGVPEIVVVHRPRYADWTLPKGKLLPNEPELLAAVREVGEEVGARVAVQQRIATVRYYVGEVRKKVTYWSMRYLDGDFEPNDEVDAIRWLPVAGARRTLTYDLDRGIVSDFAVFPPADAVIVLVRHAKAGKRSKWPGEDQLRPLDASGKRQAAELVTLLSTFAPTDIYTADRTRCLQTVEPLGEELGLRARIDAAFSDDQFEDGPSGTQSALLALAKPGRVAVVCSQGLTIPSLIDQLGPGLRASDTRKGAWWVLTVVDGDVVSTDYYDAP